MWYVDMVEHVLDVLQVSAREHSPCDHCCYVPQWLGILLVRGQVFGMGLIGLFCALWALFRHKSASLAFLLLLLFTVILPIPYGLLTGFFIDFSSKCGGGMIYLYLAPICALPGSILAWLLFLGVWAVHTIHQRRKRRLSHLPHP